MNRRWEWGAVAGPLVLDMLLAGALAIAGVVELALSGTFAPRDIGFALFMTVPLAWRRRWPLGSTLVAMTASAAVGRPPGELHLVLVVILIAMFSLGTHASRRAAVLGVLFALVAFWTEIALTSRGNRLADVASAAAVVVTPFAVGRAMRGRQLRLVASEERAERLEVEREAKAFRAASEERARIARELHDVIAHGVSVMVIQAGAATEVLSRDPEAARGALVAIQETGRQALADLRHMLGIVREGDPLTLAPRPGLEQLDLLLDQVRTAGVPVELEVRGAPRTLAGGVDVSAFRILQEALTNVIKHAGPARARVVIAYNADAVELDVIDDGRGLQNGQGQGHGLIGMRERVALYDGTLEAGPALPNGFRVHARLPLTRSA